MRLDIRKSDFPVYYSEGNVKQCFVGTKWPDRILKVSPIGGRHTPLEIDYFERLERRGIHSDCIPKYYGWFQDEQWIGYVQERIEGESVMTVTQFLQKYCLNAEAIDKLEDTLRGLYRHIVDSGLLVLNVHTSNLLINARDMHVWVIDGFGTPEHVPLPYWFEYCRKRKLKIHWLEKFKDRYLKTKQQAIERARSAEKLRD